MDTVALARELFVGAAMKAITVDNDDDAQEWADKLERVARHMSRAEIAEAEQCVEAILRTIDHD
jgi:hypothetical protein